MTEPALMLFWDTSLVDDEEVTAALVAFSGFREHRGLERARASAGSRTDLLRGERADRAARRLSLEASSFTPDEDFPEWRVMLRVGGV